MDRPERRLVSVPTPIYDKLKAYAQQHGISMGAAIDRTLLSASILEDYRSDGKLDGQ